MKSYCFHVSIIKHNNRQMCRLRNIYVIQIHSFQSSVWIFRCILQSKLSSHLVSKCSAKAVLLMHWNSSLCLKIVGVSVPRSASHFLMSSVHYTIVIMEYLLWRKTILRELHTISTIISCLSFKLSIVDLCFVGLF